jgi:hypothetical protein
VAARCTRCPTASFAGRGATATRAAGPGTIATSNRSTTGFSPGTIPIAVMGIVPTEPADSLPVESTAPSKYPPALRNTTRAFGDRLARFVQQLGAEANGVAGDDRARRRSDDEPLLPLRARAAGERSHQRGRQDEC